MGNNYVKIINETHQTIDIMFHRGGSCCHYLESGESYQINEYEVIIEDETYDISSSKCYTKTSRNGYKITYTPRKDNKSLPRLTISDQ